MTKRQRQDAHHREVVYAYYQSGDEAMLGPVLVELRPRLLALARGIFGVRDQERAEDLVQETFARLVVKLHARIYEPAASSLASYAGGFLRVVVLESKHPTASDPGAEEDPFRTVGDVLTFEHIGLIEQVTATTEAAHLVTAATQAVLSLDPAARAAVLLHFYQGLPDAQAAQQLGISERSYHARLQRGLVALRGWGKQQARPSAEVYAALPGVDTGDLFREPLRLAG